MTGCKHEWLPGYLLYRTPYARSIPHVCLFRKLQHVRKSERWRRGHATGHPITAARQVLTKHLCYLLLSLLDLRSHYADLRPERQRHKSRCHRCYSILLLFFNLSSEVTVTACFNRCLRLVSHWNMAYVHHDFGLAAEPVSEQMAFNE